jgi:hypothetical protein
MLGHQSTDNCDTFARPFSGGQLRSSSLLVGYK